MEFSELLTKRKSLRAYTGEAITEEELRLLLEAGVAAPNACNSQCWHFFCSLDREFIASLVPEVYAKPWLADAGAVVLLAAKPEANEARFGTLARERFAIQDTAAAATQMLQRATDIGLGGCWIGAFDRDAARKVFAVPADMEPVIILCLGHPALDTPPRPRKPMSEVVTMVGKNDKPLH